MAVKILIPAVLLFLSSMAIGQDRPKFMGREVTITESKKADADGFFPKGPASVCVEGPPQRQCYTAPEKYGNNPEVELVQLTKDMPALFFSAESGGTSGFGIHFALLRPGTGKSLQDLFFSDMSVSNQSEHAFWNDSTISDTPIFLTADFVWGSDETHYVEHRYMTVRKYDLDANADILASEKPEILARLARVKAETELQKRAPR